MQYGLGNGGSKSCLHKGDYQPVLTKVELLLLDVPFSRAL